MRLTTGGLGEVSGGLSPVLLERIGRDMRDTVDHLVTDLPPVDQSQELLGRHVEPTRCF